MGATLRESDYQARLLKKLRRLFPDCVILKNDASLLQGIPDLTILYGNTWAMLEVKTSKAAPTRPNQRYYVDELDRMSFAAFIYPENESEVLSDLQQAFESARISRVS